MSDKSAPAGGDPKADCADWADKGSDYVGVGAGLAAGGLCRNANLGAFAGVAAAHASEPFLEQLCNWAQEHSDPNLHSFMAGAYVDAKIGDPYADNDYPADPGGDLGAGGYADGGGSDGGDGGGD
ncbi:hypothetical protein [Caulobacter endophyticus]|uniref:hypothetical protein n=1 Tax=Caulobacter endophyticus TaxID=2172652 RepID=UPI00240F638A|nr:hypothetical protein [Caulobacter endophyticus]MDG2528914.1 hypothetical protein [Caulobacter endophyticus]